MENTAGKTKRLNVKIRSIKDYLLLFNNMLGLTKAEIEVLSEFMDLQIRQPDGIPVNTFSSDMKLIVANKLGYNNPASLNNYVKSFYEKGAIEKSKHGKGYRVKDILFPLFNLNGNNGTEKIEIHVSGKIS